MSKVYVLVTTDRSAESRGQVLSLSVHATPTSAMEAAEHGVTWSESYYSLDEPNGWARSVTLSMVGAALQTIREYEVRE